MSPAKAQVAAGAAAQANALSGGLELVTDQVPSRGPLAPVCAAPGRKGGAQATSERCSRPAVRDAPDVARQERASRGCSVHRKGFAGHLDGARPRDAADVIARQIDQHSRAAARSPVVGRQPTSGGLCPARSTPRRGRARQRRMAIFAPVSPSKGSNVPGVPGFRATPTEVRQHRATWKSLRGCSKHVGRRIERAQRVGTARSAATRWRASMRCPTLLPAQIVFLPAAISGPGTLPRAARQSASAKSRSARKV